MNRVCASTHAPLSRIIAEELAKLDWEKADLGGGAKAMSGK